MSTGRGPAYALLGLAGLLIAIAVSSGWSGAARLAGREHDASAVEDAAATFVVAYGTFDFRDAGGYTARLAELTTGELRDAIAGAAVDPKAAAQQRTTTTSVESVSVTALSGTVATAALRSRHERTWRDRASGRVVQEHVVQHVSCRLVREGERWLVAELLLNSEEPVVTPRGR